ncbi:Hypothetical predicted protein [Octopus vulgaris]|uniref:Uncharacterized protein n=1 Tax=Octopus vulgaris TaxID=6645 RepID=A0AA36AFK9_OCTVU|nr:Hypothetical predicted protein [Octopus vulgaris]
MVRFENREVGVDREKSRQEEQRNSDGAVKDEERKLYRVNPDTVMNGNAGEMNQLDNELLEIQRRLAELGNALEEKKIQMNMRRVDRSITNKVTQRINTVIPYIQSEDITQTGNLLRVIALLVEEKLQLKGTRNGGNHGGNGALKGT